MSREKYELCYRLTTDALGKLVVKQKTKLAESYMQFANDYYDGAKHFAGKEEWDNALESIAYAHGFIDAGVMAGLFEIEGYHLEKVE